MAEYKFKLDRKFIGKKKILVPKENPNDTQKYILYVRRPARSVGAKVAQNLPAHDIEVTVYLEGITDKDGLKHPDIPISKTRNYELPLAAEKFIQKQMASKSSKKKSALAHADKLETGSIKAGSWSGDRGESTRKPEKIGRFIIERHSPTPDRWEVSLRRETNPKSIYDTGFITMRSFKTKRGAENYIKKSKSQYNFLVTGTPKPKDRTKPTRPRQKTPFARKSNRFW